jgi:hypothetical protein
MQYQFLPTMAGLHSKPRGELEPAAERTGKINNITNTHDEEARGAASSGNLIS